MDSASANRKAFQEMQKDCEDHKMFLATEREPSVGSQSERIEDQTLGPLILLQCASHTLSLLMKDIVSHFCWVKDVYDSAITVSKAINNNERINDMYICACKEQDVAPTVIQSHVETRFGSYHFVLRSVLKGIATLKSLCTCDPFEQLARSSAPARTLIDVVTPSNEGSFRQNAR
jgi:hypothetical protein